jgi:uncharacterized metal-binding protein
MTLASCAQCSGEWCKPQVPVEETPPYCPRRLEPRALAEADDVRGSDEEVQRLLDVARSVELDGYGVWPRVQELIEFSKRLGVKRIGVAFCAGLRTETASLAKILESHGFEVATVACTVNQGCNPVGQAQVLNAQDVDVAVVMGLCIGHDMLFHRYVKVPVTNLVVKDRVTCHNPAAPLLSFYWVDRLTKSPD